MSPGIAFVATALAYATASLLFLAALLRGVEKAGRAARYVLFASVGLHAAYLAVDAFSATAPMGRVHSTLTYLSLGIIGAFLLAALKRPNISVLGAFITPIALFFFLGSGLGRSVEHVSPEARSFLLPLHIAVSEIREARVMLMDTPFLNEIARLQDERARFGAVALVQPLPISS